MVVGQTKIISSSVKYSSLVKFLKDPGYHDFLDPFCQILKVASEAKLEKLEKTKLRDGLKDISNVIINSKCSNCGQNPKPRPEESPAKETEIQGLEEYREAFKTVCDWLASPVIELKPETFDGPALRKRVITNKVLSYTGRRRGRPPKGTTRVKIPNVVSAVNSKFESNINLPDDVSDDGSIGPGFDTFDPQDDSEDEYRPQRDGLESDQDSDADKEWNGPETIKRKVGRPRTRTPKVPGIKSRRHRKKSQEPDSDNEFQVIKDGVVVSCNPILDTNNVPIPEEVLEAANQGINNNQTDGQMVTEPPAENVPTKRPRGILTAAETQAIQFVKKEADAVSKEDYGKFFKEIPFSANCSKCNQSFSKQSKLLYHRPCRYKKIKQNPICAVCGLSFKKAHLLLTHMEEKHFHSVKYECLICSSNYLSGTRDQAISHMLNVHIGEYKWHCIWPLCTKTKYRSKYQALDHVIEVHLKKPFECNLCDQIFDVKYKLSRHKDQVHLKKPRKFRPKIGKSTQWNMAKCPVGGGCKNKILLTAEAFRKHARSKHPSLGHFEIHQIIQDLEELRKERREMKNNKPLNDGKSVKPLSTVKLDINNEDGLIKLIVEENPPVAPALLLPEIQSVTPEATIPPVIEYESIQELEEKAVSYLEFKKVVLDDVRHMIQLIEVAEPCVYGECSTIFKFKSKAVVHQPCSVKHIVRDPETGFRVCNVCGLKYQLPSDLERHMGWHFDPQWACKLCGKRFQDEPLCKLHIVNVHQKQNKPYKCKWINCGLMHGNKDAGIRHVFTAHFKLRPYKCEICGKTYPMEREMKKHIFDDHPAPEDMIFPCFVGHCEQMFPSVNKRRLHIVSNHKEFIWTDEIKKQNLLDGKRVKGKLELICGKLDLLESGQASVSHQKIRKKDVQGIQDRIQSEAFKERVREKRRDYMRPSRTSSVKTPKKSSGKRKKQEDSGDDSSQDHVSVVSSTPSYQPPKKSSMTASRGLSSTTVEAVPDPVDYWYQHEMHPFSTHVVPNSESGQYLETFPNP